MNIGLIIIVYLLIKLKIKYKKHCKTLIFGISELKIHSKFSFYFQKGRLEKKKNGRDSFNIEIDVFLIPKFRKFIFIVRYFSFNYFNNIFLLKKVKIRIKIVP